MKPSRVLLLGGLVLIGACRAEQPDIQTVDAASVAASSKHGLPLLLRGLFAHDGFQLSCTFYEGELGLDIHTTEKDPTFGNWDVHNEQHSVSYEVLAACVRHGNELYLAGLQRGSIVIEEWIFPEWDGGYASSHPKSGTSIGVPTAVTETSVYVAGTTFVPQSSRGAKPQPQKTVVYQGAHFAAKGIAEMRIDPEGRFALILTDTDDELYQVPFDGSDTANLLYDPQTLAGLSGSESFQGLQKAGVERRYVIYQIPMPGQPCTVLQDTDNDGVFESNYVTTVDVTDGLLSAGWFDLYTRY